MTRVDPEEVAVPEMRGVGWAQLAPILVVHLCGTLGFSIGLPILVFLVADLGGAAWTYGLLGATYSAAQMVGAPILGRWSDRVGRRPVLLVSQGGTAAAWVLFLVALQVPRESFGTFAGAELSLPLLLVFAARFVDGLTGGNISVANAYVADLTRDEQRARQVSFGRMGMAASLGFTVGPALSGLLGFEGDPYTRPVLAALAISAVGVVLCARLREPSGRCPEGPPPQSTVSRVLGQQQRRCDREPEAVPRGFLAHARVRLVLATTFLMFLGFNVYYAGFPLHATEGIGWSTWEMGLFYSVMSAAMLVTQGPMLQAASRVLSRRWLLVAGLGGLVLAFLAFPGATSTAAFTGGLLFAFGNGLSWPTFQALSADTAKASDQGTLQGAMASAGSLASIVGLTVGGVLYPHLAGNLFLVSSALFAAVMLLTPRLFRPSAPAGA